MRNTLFFPMIASLIGSGVALILTIYGIQSGTWYETNPNVSGMLAIFPSWLVFYGIGAYKISTIIIAYVIWNHVATWTSRRYLVIEGLVACILSFGFVYDGVHDGLLLVNIQTPVLPPFLFF